MSHLIILIEKGKSIYGNYQNLAEQIGVPPSHISMWKKGTRTCTAPDRAALATAVNEDPAEAAIEAVIDGINLTTPQGKRATHALQVALHTLRAHTEANIKKL